jgi:phage shock protein PspC (stress-responsive transcriptional regulator)
LSSYLASQLGAAFGLGFPGIIAPLFFRRSRPASVLSGVAAALILPLASIYYGIETRPVADRFVLLALAALIGAGCGLIFYAIAGRPKPR